ncbi:MAG: LON peptidase substrate-binding domain-containing protein [Actinomycetota bacterium]
MLIPLFPLHVVLFPGVALPLHIFEPRYREMMTEVLGTDKAPSPDSSFGVVCIRAGYEVGEPAETHDIGCLATVEQAVHNKDGTMDLIVRGTQRFRIDERPPDDPYPRASVTVIDEKPGRAPERAVQLARAALDRYLAVVARIAEKESPELTLPADPVAASFTASALLAVDLPILQELAEAKTASERLTNVAKIARSEAHLLETVGPPVPRPPVDRASMN